MLDLQLFAEERTERATPRRREEARRRGQVARSSELNSALVLLGTFLFLRYFAPWAAERFLGFAGSLLGELPRGELGAGFVARLGGELLSAFCWTCLPVLVVAFGSGLFANCIQVGFLFTGYPLSPRLDRINPVAGFQRLFSRRALLELLKALAKLGVVGYLTYGLVRKHLDLFPRLLDMSVAESVRCLAVLTSDLVLRIGVLLLFLAVLDYAFQYWEHERALRMTRQELKEELRQYEGDPHVRARLRRRQRQRALSRMIQQVPKADVVITNPVHYAVALKYEPEKMAAPVVVAKGADHLALRIKEVAARHGVSIYEDPPLAQALYWGVEVGQEIPRALYEAVARVLAFVYRLRAAGRRAWR